MTEAELKAWAERNTDLLVEVKAAVLALFAERDALKEVVSETYTALVKAGPSIGDLAGKGLPYAVEALEARLRELPRKEAEEVARAVARAGAAEAKLAEADQRLQHATADLAVVRRTADAYSARVEALEKALRYIRDRCKPLPGGGLDPDRHHTPAVVFDVASDALARKEGP